MPPTAEQLEIRELAREFAENEIAPHAEAWDAARRIPDELFGKLAELGFLGMRIPETFGGLDLDFPTYLAVLEELARADASVALAVAIHSGPVPAILMAHGADAQRARWLPRLASGEILGAFALTEGDAGSDAGALACQARPVADGWILDGSKRWVTNGARAGLVVTFARTGPDAVGCFLVEPRSAGYGVERRVTTMGHRASETVDIALTGVSLEPEALVGDPG